MKSAEARLLRASSLLPGKLQPTSPLPSQSKRGPTSSLSSAMNPSRDTAATPMIVLPVILSFRSVIVYHYRFDPLRPWSGRVDSGGDAGGGDDLDQRRATSTSLRLTSPSRIS